MAKVKEEKPTSCGSWTRRRFPYTPTPIPHGDGEAPDGVTVARSPGAGPGAGLQDAGDPGGIRGYYVFDIPVTDTLDLKKAAKAVGRSPSPCSTAGSCPPDRLCPRGCSPIGMKKQFPTVFHETAEILDTIMVSAGKIGFQVELSPADLIELVGGSTEDVTV